uniref:Protein DENND6B n=1 Tax=Cacopsylla melanoneura TaxID=428564 RepID=A0A8D8W6C4_9HEMI
MFKPWERFHNWFHCVCVVTFDIELGQTIEAIYPSEDGSGDMEILTEEDKTNICYLAFPDSNSSCIGDTNFFIRIRRTTPMQLTDFQTWYNARSPVNLQASSDYFYGFVHFRQVKDDTLPRGYFQKSIVLLSPMPFVSLFSDVCSIIAQEVFDKDFSVLTKACKEIDLWTQPRPLSKIKETVTLPLLGTSLRVDIPHETRRFLTHYILNDPSRGIQSSLQCSKFEMDAFQKFSSLLSHVQLLWELVLTCEPIIVMTSSPVICSQMVYFLVSLINPLIYFAEYRPYFTIHDSDFKDYTSKTNTVPPAILGVTNPFFTKTLQHWPHIINLDKDASGHSNKLKKYTSNKLMDSTPGFYTQYKPLLQKDKSFSKKLTKGQRPPQAQMTMFKQHIQDLTESFLHPLERYIQSKSMPLMKDINPFKSPRPNPFDQEEFLADLSKPGGLLTSKTKGDWVNLYKRFFNSPNFQGWYDQKLKDIQQKLTELHLEKLSEEDFKVWVKDKKEVELIDMIMNIQNKLKEIFSAETNARKESVHRKLKDCICDIRNALPLDTQSFLKDMDGSEF